MTTILIYIKNILFFSLVYEVCHCPTSRSPSPIADGKYSQSAYLTPVSLQHRIFRRVPSKNRRDRLLSAERIEINDITSTLELQERIQESAFDASSVAQIIVDSHGILMKEPRGVIVMMEEK
ncbi:hypothetical protein [Pleurocapsa sp. PCC 7319]|uniref:hypothetical protein n=1 Tax=Pleurocapsa sp. PCC 7319 TaxID=118161 RepID=UPI001181BE8F|nr:hypothetical protein [Pleurocapsa sp. PCC 7319]